MMTDAEFDELKRKRAEAVSGFAAEIARKYGVDCDAAGCYCACPEGPCQHVWDGPEYREENMSSVTCSRCGEPAIYHDMRCGP